MWQGFPLHPQDASTIAPAVDHLYYFLTAVDLFFTALIFLTIFYFAIRYHRRSEKDRPPKVEPPMALELAWTIIPAILCAIMFTWSASIYIREARPPRASMEIFVVAKQWMWKIQHPNGRREIDALHIPVGTPIKLTMTSQDVIHDFFVPAFRVKHDVVPGSYEYLWFEATKVGKYHFFCAQYCGTNHSKMRGWVYVMEPADYERWLHEGVKPVSMAEAGAQLYEKFGCITCHGTGKGPSYAGLYGSHVKLSDGTTVLADDSYLRESILFPTAQIVAGYRPIMPTFKGQLTEEEILDLIAYIKSQATLPAERTAK
jgi:cytochrome c oxidase subunit II